MDVERHFQYLHNKHVELEMDVDKAGIHFTRKGLVIGKRSAIGGNLIIIRLDRDVRHSLFYLKKIRYIGIEVLADQYYKAGMDNEAIPVSGFDMGVFHVYAYKLKFDYERRVRRSKWPHIPFHLRPEDLMTLGPADFTVLG